MSLFPLTFLIMFLLSLLGLIFYRKHLLSALLCLEGMMLTLFISLSLWILKFNILAFSLSPMVLITFSACEASLGLSLLIATIRSHGVDHLQNMNMLQC